MKPPLHYLQTARLQVRRSNQKSMVNDMDGHAENNATVIGGSIAVTKESFALFSRCQVCHRLVQGAAFVLFALLAECLF